MVSDARNHLPVYSAVRISYMLTDVRYIEGNPVRTRLIQSADEWRWSCHGEKMNRAGGRLVDDLPLPLPEEWTENVNSPLTAGDLERMAQCVNWGAPFGSFSWRDGICEKLGLESTIWPKGRPRKWGQGK